VCDEDSSYIVLDSNKGTIMDYLMNLHPIQFSMVVNLNITDGEDPAIDCLINKEIYMESGFSIPKEE
jgi:hypothetical protein